MAKKRDNKDRKPALKSRASKTTKTSEKKGKISETSKTKVKDISKSTAMNEKSEVPVFDEILKYELGLKTYTSTVDPDIIKHGLSKQTGDRHASKKSMAEQIPEKTTDRFNISEELGLSHIGVPQASGTHRTSLSKGRNKRSVAVAFLLILALLGIIAIVFLSNSKPAYIDEGTCYLNIVTIIANDKNSQAVEIPGSKCHTSSDCKTMLKNMNFDQKSLDKASIDCAKKE